MKGEPWTELRTWSSLRQAGHETLIPNETNRLSIARLLDIESLNSLRATLAYEPWFDGARISGRVEADTVRLCGVTLEPLDERVETEFEGRLVPEGSPHTPKSEAELIVTLEGDDPPDVVIGDEVDLATYIVEALGLALDPFPRTPGVVFDYNEPRPETSPFAILLSKSDLK